ncbi:MAG: DUF5615 family PIN-like protein [Egibacteraceae bacterium]
MLPLNASVCSREFLIDSMLPPQIADLLEASGHHATTPTQLGAHNLPDDVLVQIAMAAGRVIVTRERQRLRARADLSGCVRPQVLVATGGAGSAFGQGAGHVGSGQSRAGTLAALAAPRPPVAHARARRVSACGALGQHHHVSSLCYPFR